MKRPVDKFKSFLKYSSVSSFLKKRTPANQSLTKEQQKSAQQSLEQLKEEVAMLTSYSSDTMYRLRYDSMSYDYISPSVVKLLGYTDEEMKNISVRSLISHTNIIDESISPVDNYASLEEARKNGEVKRWQADYLMQTKDGEHIWVMDVSFPWLDDKGNIIGSVGSLRDITSRKQAEETYKKDQKVRGSIDKLTGLSNRYSFFAQIENELHRIQRSNNHFSILLIDIDHFTAINEDHGREVGDKMLVEIGAVIRSCLRDSDILARIGGEEFGVFLPDTSHDGAYWVAERICLEAAKHNYLSAEKSIPLSCTVSIGMASTEGNRLISSEELYEQADTRLYIAKNTGRNQVSADEVIMVH